MIKKFLKIIKKVAQSCWL